jgi:hypothetical protein
MTLAGPRAWTVEEVIALCEKYADAEADVSQPSCYFICSVYACNAMLFALWLELNDRTEAKCCNTVACLWRLL